MERKSAEVYTDYSTKIPPISAADFSLYFVSSVMLISRPQSTSYATLTGIEGVKTRRHYSRFFSVKMGATHCPFIGTMTGKNLHKVPQYIHGGQVGTAILSV